MTHAFNRRMKLLLALGLLSIPLLGAVESGNRKTFSVSKGGSLEVSISGGDIRISSWEKNEVLVTSSDMDDEEGEGLSMHQNGNSVFIESSGSWGAGDERIEITVPTQFDLDLSTASGDLEVNGPLTGTIKGKTGAGEIHLGNLAGRVSMATSGGDISSGKIEGAMQLSTSGGDLSLGPVTGEVTISTSGGEITVESVGKKLLATTSGGNVSIGNVGGDAIVSTAGGDVHVGAVSGNATLKTAGGNLSLRGATGKVFASTAGGDLELENIGGSVEGSTAGGNITATLSGGKAGSSKLTTAAGNIRLYVPDNARATIHARIRLSGWWKGADDEYDIRSDFKADSYEKDKQDGEIHATYLLNGGGERISLETMMGNIEIRKGRP